MAHSQYQKSKRISIFLSMPDEIETEEIIKDIFRQGKACFIPRYQFQSNHMDMVRLASPEEISALPKTSWNIHQPREDEVREEALSTGARGASWCPVAARGGPWQPVAASGSTAALRFTFLAEGSKSTGKIPLFSLTQIGSSGHPPNQSLQPGMWMRPAPGLLTGSKEGCMFAPAALLQPLVLESGGDFSREK
ncbi:5-formyltetrahydrofolate cyclo-ligase isoform X2 [Lutra lutra]|uniref:5-formyltetrahydrofolate cyclo-ligase isoform X2 n=1 Tax=Lutra lutra TaxID=9657 RepID=UPI001FD285BB|nr:5-formyltetrahydrofolate cyclo-ligase isoform X2 [Lutra lutra]XP_047595271.1 5-formyltetrahydrofolate cyclo-ligase isoform X2 [Lutra lutra]